MMASIQESVPELVHDENGNKTPSTTKNPTAKQQQQRMDQQHDETGFSTRTEMMTQWQNCLESRDKDWIDDNEVAMKKQRQHLEEQPTSLGKATDVLHLNIGGSNKIAVLRKTLTYFEKSLLACHFCGRWDDSLEKDKDGYFFIDQDPNVFIPLLKYLRECDHRKRQDIPITPPPPSAEFCSMLEYYGLMSMVYPQEWKRVWGSENGVMVTRDDHRVTRTDGAITISNSRGLKKFMLEVQKDCPSKPVNASSFMVNFDEGSRGYVLGWASASATKGYTEHFEWVSILTKEMKDGDGGNNNDDSDEDDEDYSSDDSNDDSDDDGDERG